MQPQSLRGCWEGGGSPGGGTRAGCGAGATVCPHGAVAPTKSPAGCRQGSKQVALHWGGHNPIKEAAQPQVGLRPVAVGFLHPPAPKASHKNVF